MGNYIVDKKIWTPFKSHKPRRIRSILKKPASDHISHMHHHRILIQTMLHITCTVVLFWAHRLLADGMHQKLDAPDGHSPYPSFSYPPSTSLLSITKKRDLLMDLREGGLSIKIWNFTQSQEEHSIEPRKSESKSLASDLPVAHTLFA